MSMNINRYYSIPNDGASHKCSDCGEYFSHNQMTYMFLGSVVYNIDDPKTWPVCCCYGCADEHWIANAQFMGVFNDQAAKKEFGEYHRR